MPTLALHRPPHCRPVGTHLGPFTGKYPVAVPPTGRCVQEPPQVASLTFNAQGKVVKYTMGFVIDRVSRGVAQPAQHCAINAARGDHGACTAAAATLGGSGEAH